MADDGVDFAGTICSICYEDLKPLTEDLQSISICGHVFHELCLQQWFEYCSRSKKQTCPVCKQSCRGSDACRLYFQSVGEVSESVIPRKPLDSEEDAGILRKEVQRLEVKVSGLSSELEKKGKALEEITEQLGACKEKTKIETAIKNEALNQKATIQSQLRMKSEELEKSTYECYKLQERNMALAKELAALKLVSDLDLNEEDVLRLATLGNGSNKKDTIDTLGRSLVLQKRSYKELMAKCFALERGEGRYNKKLEKATEKINKLKTRIQELETAAEEKEKEYQMSLNASKRKRCSNDIGNSINSKTDVLTFSNFSSEEQTKQNSIPKSEMNLSVNNSKSPQFFKIANHNDENKEVNCNGSKSSPLLDKERDFISIVDDDASEFTETFCGHLRHNSNSQDRDGAAVLSEPTVTESCAASGVKREVMHGKCDSAKSSRIDIDIEMANTSADAIDEDVTILDNIKQVQPVVNIRKESPLTIANPGDICFSGGLLGPDGTHRFLGKWCKRGGQNGESASVKGLTNGDLISVGADGRGGKAKSLRTPSKTFLGGKENALSSKRSKLGPKTSSLQSKGCMQIEHFFGKVNH